MEPITVAASAGLVMNYLLPAIRHFGDRVLATSEESASNAAVALGTRMLRTMLPNREKVAPAHPGLATLQGGVERRVMAVASDPGDAKAAIQLEGAIEDLLVAAPEMFASIVRLLDQAPGGSAPQGHRASYIGGDSSGTVITGDGNSVTTGS